MWYDGAVFVWKKSHIQPADLCNQSICYEHDAEILFAARVN
jgi:hypothetical protein